jgi:hypothetical protein
VLGHEIIVLTQAIAGAFDLDDDGVVKKPVQQGGGDHWIAEHGKVRQSLSGSCLT